jgi:MmyB-like transcription regulator ligand binding domain
VSGYESGEFLRVRRSRLTPGDVGLPAAGARRVTGLRREEVAVLADALADALLSPLTDRRDMVRSLFYDPAARGLFAQWPTVARDTVHALRLAAGREQRDPLLTELIAELSANSPEFAAIWQEYEVHSLGRKSKVFNHPDVGRIELTYQAFDIQSEPGRQLLVGTAEPSSTYADSLALLGSLHTANHTR